MASNAIFVIRPYQWEGLWVFDDDRVGLVKEPFVAGADTMIDTALARKGINNGERGFLLFFSKHPFPDADFDIDWLREESAGNVYSWPETGQEGWLCPALLLYFPEAPKKLYLKLRAIDTSGP